MIRKRVRKSRAIRWILAGWIFILVMGVILTALHFIGWIIATTAIAGLAYSAGRYPQWKHDKAVITTNSERLRKIRVSSEYGKAWRSSEITPTGRIDYMDAVSPYPDEMRIPGKSVTSDIRNRIIADLRSGARPLTDGDTDDAGPYSA
jgi:hypothetical protein